MSLKEKVAVLDQLQQGASVGSVDHRYRVNESTIRSIRKLENAIREAVKIAALSSRKVTIIVKDPVIEKMEEALCI